jgi:hypothetical protein
VTVGNSTQNKAVSLLDFFVLIQSHTVFHLVTLSICGGEVKRNILVLITFINSLLGAFEIVTVFFMRSWLQSNIQWKISVLTMACLT